LDRIGIKFDWIGSENVEPTDPIQIRLNKNWADRFDPDPIKNFSDVPTPDSDGFFSD
jgi:hypothetical protein